MRRINTSSKEKVTVDNSADVANNSSITYCDCSWKISLEYVNETYTLLKTVLRNACKLASTSNKDMGKKDEYGNLYVSSWLHL